MSCPKASTSTLLWLYEGNLEALETSALSHIASCEDCQEVVALHGDLIATLGPVLPALRPSVHTTRSRLNYATWGGAALAIAAIAATWMIAVPSNLELRDTGLTPAEQSSAALTTDFWADDNFENDLDALEQELRALSMDLLTL